MKFAAAMGLSDLLPIRSAGGGKMKILLVGNYVPDHQDSMQFYARMLEKGMRARGHSVHLLQPPVVLGSRLASSSSFSKWLGYADKFLLFRSELRRAAAQADIVHLCDHSNAMYVPMLAGSPHVVTCHDILAIRSAMGQFPENRVRAPGRLFQRLIARGLQQARVILCVSNKTREDLQTYLGVSESRLHVVPNALHWPYAPLDEAQRAPLLRSLGLPPGDPYFLQVGGNHWYKNRSATIAIFAELHKRPHYAHARLVMAGGAVTSELRALAKQHRLDDALIEIVGPSNEQLQALYSGALATLFPSLEEGFGWPIVESQACGCPVVIADRPPMNEVAGGAAILIDPADPATAASRIAEALTEPAELRESGLRNAATFSATTMLDACDALYRAAITKGF